LNKGVKGQFGLYLLLGAGFFFTIYPLCMLLFGSLKHQMQLINNPWFITLPVYMRNYTIAVRQILFPIVNSFIVTSLGIGITLAGSSLASYAFAIHSFPGRTFWYFFIICLLMVPGFVILIPQFLVVSSLGLNNTYLGQVLPPAANNIALGVMLMTSFFKGIPNSIIESAQIEGCGEIGLLFKIVVPLSKPILAAVSITTGIALWNNFMWSLIITSGRKVMPVIVAISRLQATINEGNGPVFAAYVIAALPVLLFFVFASKAFVIGLTAGAVKG
jgi:ABC-type glycerol-3-phosphate transport system permease component